MAIEIRVPALGESITDATVGKWYKKAGDSARIDEPIVELETDKVTIEVPSPINGTITNIITPQGEDVKVGTIIGLMIEADTEATASPETIPNKPEQQPKPQSVEIMTQKKKLPHRIQTVPSPGLSLFSNASNNSSSATSPLLDNVLSPEPTNEAAREERVPMSRLRRTIARRLQEVQQTTAMLTTFNEVDMLNIMTLRKTYKDAFLNKHHVKLGLMSFFVKAITQSLQAFPSLNAEIDNTDLIFKKYYHIGVAVGTEQGLVVPVLKDADRMTFEEIEKNIAALADKARNGLLTIEELQGGSFSLTNGGIYGSMMSTPILNAPQSAILGMHNIQDRPIALNGEVVIRPMMYLALTYDHRIVDGKDAVSFLTHVKKSLESPERLFLDL